MAGELKAFCSLSECNKDADFKCEDCESLVEEEIKNPMSNEEAIAILKRVEIAKPIKFEDYADMRETLDLAIKSLESWDKLDTIIIEQLDKTTDQKECMTLRWVLDKMAEVRG